MVVQPRFLVILLGICIRINPWLIYIFIDFQSKKKNGYFSKQIVVNGEIKQVRVARPRVDRIPVDLTLTVGDCSLTRFKLVK